MNQTITHSLQEDALLAARRASSIGKKGMFLNKEEPLLRSPLSSLQTMMVVITEIKQSFLPTRLASHLLLSATLLGQLHILLPATIDEESGVRLPSLG